MKNKKIIIILFILIQVIQIFINVKPVKAQIYEGDEVELLRRS